MTRRSPPQRDIDEGSFPIRICFRIPQGGLRKTLSQIYQWLDKYIGRGDYALHSHSSPIERNACALYLRSADAVYALCTQFPDLELADGVDGEVYTSPNKLKAPGSGSDDAVCNLYSQTRAQDAIRQLFKGVTFTDRLGNLEPGSIYPDRPAPIIRHDVETGGLELVRARWGMPSPPSVLKTERDPGVTNVRNLGSPHWRRWLGPAHRCLVPLTSFAEPRGPGRGNQWFASAEDQPMFFAGIETRGWRSTRKLKDGETEDDLYAFLTCAPNAEVGAIHPKAMPAILTEPQEWETWMGAPLEVAALLQRPLPDGALRLVEEPI